jgi:hypothetical protein
MKFLGGSPLSDAELEAMARNLVDTYGEDAKNVVNRFIDRANAAGEFEEHATWMNVSFGVIQILRPDPRWSK